MYVRQDISNSVSRIIPIGIFVARNAVFTVFQKL